MAQSDTPWHKSAEFLKLQRKWYQKLKASGFKDIEISEENPLLLGFGNNDARRKWTPEKQRYYELASQYRWRFHPDSQEYRVFSYHAEGISYANIAKLVPWSKTTIYRFVRRHKRILLGELRRS